MFNSTPIDTQEDFTNLCQMVQKNILMEYQASTFIRPQAFLQITRVPFGPRLEKPQLICLPPSIENDFTTEGYLDEIKSGIRTLRAEATIIVMPAIVKKVAPTNDNSQTEESENGVSIFCEHYLYGSSVFFAKFTENDASLRHFEKIDYTPDGGVFTNLLLEDAKDFLYTRDVGIA